MSFYVGIDLGTTNSTVSVIQTKTDFDSPLETLTTCDIYQYKEVEGDWIAEKCLPSALYFDVDGKRVYTGNYAKYTYGTGNFPLQSARSVKTRMGGDSRLEIPSRFNKSGVEYFTMKECSSFFIRTIADTLRKNYPDVPNLLDECIVTVPAAFNDDERTDTQNAVLLGGFKKCKILDEPTAALLSYVNSDSFAGDDEDTTYKLVYDIGGGTLDVSIAKLTSDDEGNYTIDIVGLSDRMNLGGDDFDRLLAAYFLKEFEMTNRPIETLSPEQKERIIARLVSNAEDYKIKLNEKILECGENKKRLSNVTEQVTFELIDGKYIDGITLNKGLFDEIFACYANPDENKNSLLTPIKTALKRANLHKSKISEIILTGGMSTFYSVYESLKNFFGDVPINYVEDTRTAVSRGAALYHWGLDKNNESDNVRRISTISNRLANNYYVRNAEGKFELLIKADLKQKQGIFQYTVLDEDVAFLPFYLYSGSEPEHGEDNTAGFKQLIGYPVPMKPHYKKGTKIPFAWSVDENKTVTVKVQGDESIKLSRLLSAEEIKNNVALKYRVN